MIPALSPEDALAARNLELLAMYLRANDAPCPGCGYNLRHLSRQTCPECGQPFALRVGAPLSHVGPLLVCLAPLLMMTGLTAFLAAMTIKYGSPGNGVWYSVLLPAGVVTAVVAMAVYSRRFRFLALPISRQRELAFLSGALTMTVFLLAILLSLSERPRA